MPDRRAHRFEPEFELPPPRDVPPELRAGPFARARRRNAAALIAAGAMLFALSLVPVVALWGQFFLPLAYLDWIGAALLALGAGVFAYSLVAKGPCRYVEEGLPLAGRVAALELRTTAFYNGQANEFRYFALVEYADPETGEERRAELFSDKLTAMNRDEWEPTYRVGDTVTLVYFPERFEKSLRLYGFLGLREGEGLVRKDGGSGGSPLKAAFGAAALAAFVFAMFWNVYAIDRYGPIELEGAQLIPVGLGGAVLCGVALAVILAEHRGKLRALEERNAAAEAEGRAVEAVPAGGPLGGCFKTGFAVLGLFLMSAFTAACWAWTLNAWLDDSPAEYRPVLVTGMKQTTHKGVFRTYTVEYRFLLDPEGRKHDYSSTPAEMAAFRGPLARADVRGGAFGWKWLKAIEPLNLPALGNAFPGVAPPEVDGDDKP